MRNPILNHFYWEFSTYGWYFWSDPYSLLRLHESHGKKKYFYELPQRELTNWQYFTGNPAYYYTEDENLVKETFGFVPTGFHRLYWYSNNYSI